MAWLFVLTVLAALAHYLRNSPPPGRLYRCVEDGDNSALYERRLRHVEYWGSCGPVRFPLEWDVEEFRRVTCAPGVLYTAATSDWFKRGWCDKRSAPVFSYVALKPAEARRRWREQLPVTRKVAQALKRCTNPHQGCPAN